MRKSKPKPEQDAKGRFVAGNSGNGGRPKGSRALLGESFIQDMYAVWTKEGPDIIARVAAEDPASLLRSMVAILPKEVDVNINKYDALTDEQLRAQFVAALREAQSLGIDVGVGDAAGADPPRSGKPH